MGQPAFTSPNDPYTDQNLTARNPSHTDITPTPPYNNNQEQVPVYDPAGRQTSGFSHVAAPAVSPNSWVEGRDPYKNNGMVGQPSFNNGGS